MDKIFNPLAEEDNNYIDFPPRDTLHNSFYRVGMM